ncbi:MAG: tyrosine-type recombinase/integrase [Verrucomicrobiae bacterium]|nr:tyrosine-type recombinase/integrase [Verrucomicrobiae bacterium]
MGQRESNSAKNTASNRKVAKREKVKFEKVGECLYRYRSNGVYYAVVRHQGKLSWKSLKTDNRAIAIRKLGEYRAKLSRTDVSAGRMTLESLCSDYLKSLSQSPRTIEEKKRIVEKIKKDWPAAEKAQCQVKSVRPADVSMWLAGYRFGPSAYNACLWFIRGALEFAVENGLVAENPAARIKAKKREKPIRHTPTFEQFQKLVADIRAKELNRRANHSANLVEFMGLAGVGNAEVNNLIWGDVDFDKEKITLFRQKTRQGYQIPLFPQVRGLLEKIKGKRDPSPGEKVFKTQDAKKALSASCKRLNYPHFDHRSLRRMFVTRALQRGVDVKTVSGWQGHQDGGRLILSTYSHVLSEHSDRMAKLMTTEKKKGGLS